MRCARRDLRASAHRGRYSERLRARAPRVHCITNAVAQTFTANMLLAAGAVPSMTIAAEEIGAFAARADALLVNLGTFDAERREAALRRSRSRGERGHPLGARSGVHRPLAAARGLREDARWRRSPRALRLNARRVRRAVGRRAGRCGAGALCARQRTVIGADRRERFRRRRRAADADRQRPSADGARHRDGLRGSALVAACLAVEPDALARRRRRRCCASASPAKSPASARSGPGSFAVGEFSMRSMRSTATR